MANNISKDTKAVRLLGGRRFVHAHLSDGQEAFTKTIDIGAGEIYTQVSDIPNASSKLWHSGEQSDYLIVSNSSGENILRYWHKHRLTPSNQNGDTNGSSYFFLSGSELTNIAPSDISSLQQTNFISNKYIQPADAANNADALGYNVAVYVGGSLTSQEYSFDYKTGILQFNSYDPGGSTVNLSAYQYIGRTLQDDDLTNPASAGVVAKSKLFNAFEFGATASFESYAGKSSYSAGEAYSSYWEVEESRGIILGSEMVHTNGLLQDSGSTNDYIIYPSESGGSTVSGATKTVIEFTYRIPNTTNSKVKVTYLPKD
tara:strand:+ start:227 stop:1171 length:945 start_codon:yes stop_codon:yes gene_type:complete